MHCQIREDLGPDVALVSIDDLIDHLHQVFVLEVFVDLLDDDLRLSLAFQPFVENEQVLVAAAGPAHRNLLAGEIVDRGNCRSRRPCGAWSFSL
jgi:hypothetical protein